MRREVKLLNAKRQKIPVKGFPGQIFYAFLCALYMGAGTDGPSAILGSICEL